MALDRRGLGNAKLETFVSGAHRCIGFAHGFGFRRLACDRRGVCMSDGNFGHRRSSKDLVSASPVSSSRREATYDSLQLSKKRLGGACLVSRVRAFGERLSRPPRRDYYPDLV